MLYQAVCVLSENCTFDILISLFFFSYFFFHFYTSIFYIHVGNFKLLGTNLIMITECRFFNFSMYQNFLCTCIYI